MTNLPPNDEDDTTPALAAADTEPPPPIIPVGEARMVLGAALQALSRAQANVEAVAMACARALDTTPPVAP